MPTTIEGTTYFTESEVKVGFIPKDRHESIISERIAVELCLALAREAVLEVIESGQNGIDDALVESISIDVKQAHDFSLAEFLLVIVIVIGHLKNLLIVDHFDADDAACEATVPRELLGKHRLWELPSRSRVAITAQWEASNGPFGAFH